MVNLDANCCYQAVLTRNPRFDGVFFVGVSTTRVYCRTICSAKTPQQKNCTFYSSTAAAEAGGFRPCLLCRPELAPSNAYIDANGRLAAAVIRHMEDGTFIEQGFEYLAQELRVSEEDIHQIVLQEFGVSLSQLLQTHRLLLAKRLLTDTTLSIADIASASGFKSLQNLDTLFQECYRLKPTQLRKAKIVKTAQDYLVSEVAYRPPLDWEALLSYLRIHAIAGVEKVEDNCYYRTVRLGEQQGWLMVEPIKGKNALQVKLSTSLLPVLLSVLRKIKALFDLAAEPEQIAAHLGSLALHHPGLRVPGAFDGFEIAVRTIIGQQVSVKAATTLMRRFVQCFGEPIVTPFPTLTHLTPSVEQIAQADITTITNLGIIKTRANSILELAQAIAQRSISLTPTSSIDQTIAQLQELPGIGTWTAQYIAMRVLAAPNAFLHTDLGIRQVLGESSAKRILAFSSQWQPWRSYATLHLWKYLERAEKFISHLDTV
ncbi:DNA-3-methyladenine glycosylase 2 (plasmid) [Nostoc sp. UHCC 0926]|uniref:DNA-3-methyladenine glycosylase 2 n=1 Tax=Nostoc sp. UHCC 0926 TaxID=3025190 RepID=UPI00236045E8|nr:DNA-3-methyladenine glycosylase 2 [Nostoc sp. UHCC 0926]WDD30179.1 DNA-3-methyladenine glycosylase 2 [Nostoc sp. UHCC 0926]